MARWTDKYAILRDLAYAQGSTPLDIVDPISHNEKPPRDCGEDFYSECLENVDFSGGPDIGMIQELLKAVQEANASPNDDNPFEINKLNTDCQESIPGSSGDQTPKCDSRQEQNENIKKKKNRNAAVLSLIETYGEPPEVMNQDDNDSQMKLLKPNDFIKNEEASSQDKVTGWLNSSENRLVSPAGMFRKKRLPPNGLMFKKKEEPIAVTTKCENKTEVYVPSSMASEYYEKYVEKSKMREILSDDIWTRAEKTMKKIDEKRKQEKETHRKEQPTNSTNPETVSDDNSTDCTTVVTEPSS